MQLSVLNCCSKNTCGRDVLVPVWMTSYNARARSFVLDRGALWADAVVCVCMHVCMCMCMSALACVHDRLIMICL